MALKKPREKSGTDLIPDSFQPSDEYTSGFDSLIQSVIKRFDTAYQLQVERVVALHGCEKDFNEAFSSISKQIVSGEINRNTIEDDHTVVVFSVFSDDELEWPTSLRRLAMIFLICAAQARQRGDQEIAWEMLARSSSYSGVLPSRVKDLLPVESEEPKRRGGHVKAERGIKVRAKAIELLSEMSARGIRLEREELYKKLQPVLKKFREENRLVFDKLDDDIGRLRAWFTKYPDLRDAVNACSTEPLHKKKRGSSSPSNHSRHTPSS